MLKIKIVILFLFISIASVWGYVNYQTYWMKPSAGAQDVSIEIKEGESVAQLANELKQAEVIKNIWLFKRYLAKNGMDKKLQVGTFVMKPNMNIKSVALILNDPHIASTKVLFKEGETVKDYGDELEKSDLMRSAEFQGLVGYPAVNYCLNESLDKPKDFSDEFDFLLDKPKCLGLEGYLFPDTYFFANDAPAEVVARKMLENFGVKLDSGLRAEIARQNKTIHEIITMASLIEAEAREESDRALVSDVLWRRNSVGMGLELDSTVNYLTGNSKPSISFTEKEINSLYNTYKYRGLPPGPINNPSLSAIKAAIYPEKNDYWFFLADKEGKVHFGKTLEEHNQLKYKYLK
ncbi:endolytic transglycosylase MltG [Patescibacteria group bacterium]|nr:endolytic transglycosylase MltG [Patescibacteria group bacterium]MBU1612975.1 endolytic transglycosylase MltG [Patescibacteria group bacterium]